ncbi:hypothetical protein AQUCO_02800293v1 [Aquilegia coerulea]|uniref:Uncharacterized protein n=1 Tax=Aquilegia coerulea TaxID=218851 RepID=A0A2G5D4R4_AQUCA|nr:hypothetical protein AQUCO_02800293v1 [Aquilegia coerulea]
MSVSRPQAPFTASLLGDSQLQVPRKTEIAVPNVQDRKGRIKEMFKKVELSVSSYDTAWVAKVASPDSPQNPCFPECLNWLLENQLYDGSWSLPRRNDLLIKDSMMSTLASVLALRQWEMGEEHVRKGLDFMGSNLGAIVDQKQHSPTGFNIIFPGMIENAKDLGLKLPLSANIVDKMLRERDLELERIFKCNSNGSKAYLAYVSEGLRTKLYDSNEIKKYRRKNGSILNSPATTAALLSRCHDAEGLKYLRSVLDIFDNAVPTIYPVDVYVRLRMVDRLEKMGIANHFPSEIEQVLDETYRCWLEKDEEIFLDAETCALAFRLLKTNGYEVSSDVLAEFNEEECFFSSSGHNLKDIYSVLELYKASEIKTSPDEKVLETLHSWTSSFLKQGLSNGLIHDEKCHKEVDNALKLPYHAQLERLESRRNIECYNADNIQLLKASYRCSNIDNEDFLQLAVADYNIYQAIHQKELKSLERWIKEARLDTLEFTREKVLYGYFLIAAHLRDPELSDARTSWTKNVVLITMVDDRVDVGDRREELDNIIDLLEKWDDKSANVYCSEEVEILYGEIEKMIIELGEIAFRRQGRNVTSHLIELWLTLLRGMAKEHDWVRDKATPTLDEYMAHAHYTIGVSTTVLMTQYFLGPMLSEEIVGSAEYNNVFKHSANNCRLLNDIRTFKREADEGKLNGVLLCKHHGDLTEDIAMKEIENLVDRNERDLLNLVYKKKGSIVPKACKDILLHTSRVGHILYSKNDGFSSPVEMLGAVKAVIYEPIELPSNTV